VTDGESFPFTGVPGVQFLDTRIMPQLPVRIHRFRFDTTANRPTAAAVIEAVVGARSLSFVDEEYPAENDAVAIVAVRHQGALLAKCGGDGWSSNWVPVPTSELTMYLALCIQYLGLGSTEVCTIDEPADMSLMREPYNPSGKIDRPERSTFYRDLKVRIRDGFGEA
jgi:hypothetical protein